MNLLLSFSYQFSSNSIPGKWVLFLPTMSTPFFSSADTDLDKVEQGLASSMTPLHGSKLLHFLDIQPPSGKPHPPCPEYRHFRSIDIDWIKAEQQPAASISAHHGFQQPRSEDNTRLVFTAFAAEIRLEIYTQLFASNNLRPLRRLADLRDLREWRCHSPIPNDILRTNQMIYTEALPKLYSSYFFHIALEHQVLASPVDIKQHQLEHIRHISLGTNFGFDKKGDADSARALASIMTNCHRLKTLTLHFFTTLNGLQHQPSEEWAIETAPILRSLHSRLERLTFVAAEPNTSITSLRVAIDTKYWEMGNLETYWPMITLSQRQSNQNMILRAQQDNGLQFLMRHLPLPRGDTNGCVIQSSHLYRKHLVKQANEEAT